MDGSENTLVFGKIDNQDVILQVSKAACDHTDRQNVYDALVWGPRISADLKEGHRQPDPNSARAAAPGAAKLRPPNVHNSHPGILAKLRG